MNIAPDAWQSAKLLRATPSCTLTIMAANHPSFSTEESSLKDYLQRPPDASPIIAQAIVGLQNWKCAGRRLVAIGGRLPTTNALLTSFDKTLSKHLDRKVSFAFQQKSSLVPIMSPSPAEIGDRFTFAEVTLVQHSTLTGDLPRVTAANAKVKRKKATKVEVTQDEPPKEEA